MKSLYKYIIEDFTINGTRSNRIILFDVDDTLIHTTAKIRVLKNNKIYKVLTNAEFNEYVLGPGESFDFTEFEDAKLLNREQLTKYWSTLKREYKKGTHIGIITARGDHDMIYNFFKNKGVEIKKKLVFAVTDPKLGLAGTVAERKSTIISRLVEYGYKTMIFFDDSETNLNHAKNLEKLFDIKIITVKV